MIELLEAVLASGSLFAATLILRAGVAHAGQAPEVFYQLTFPAGLEAEPVARFASSLSGLLRPWWRRWVFQPAVVLEVVATNDGIRHRLVAPESVAASIEAALTAHLPSVRYERTDVYGRCPKVAE